jgi:hypothetical protein
MRFAPYSPATLLAAVLEPRGDIHYNLLESVIFFLLNAITHKMKFLWTFCTWEYTELNITVCLYQLPLAGRVLIACG